MALPLSYAQWERGRRWQWPEVLPILICTVYRRAASRNARVLSRRRMRATAQRCSACSTPGLFRRAPTGSVQPGAARPRRGAELAPPCVYPILRRVPWIPHERYDRAAETLMAVGCHVLFVNIPGSRPAGGLPVAAGNRLFSKVFNIKTSLEWRYSVGELSGRVVFERKV